MKAKEIRDLIDFISHSGLDEVNIETEEFKLSVKKNCRGKSETNIAQPVENVEKQQVKVGTNQLTANTVEETSFQHVVNSKEKLLTIKSPMIGTFYKSANPEADPFVKLGDIVTVGQTVGIIEAMKLFNEIESEISGKVVKILVENASPVEFDQPLFLVDPS